MHDLVIMVYTHVVEIAHDATMQLLQFWELGAQIILTCMMLPMRMCTHKNCDLMLASVSIM